MQGQHQNHQARWTFHFPVAGRLEHFQAHSRFRISASSLCLKVISSMISLKIDSQGEELCDASCAFLLWIDWQLINSSVLQSKLDSARYIKVDVKLTKFVSAMLIWSQTCSLQQHLLVLPCKPLLYSSISKTVGRNVLKVNWQSNHPGQLPEIAKISPHDLLWEHTLPKSCKMNSLLRDITERNLEIFISAARLMEASEEPQETHRTISVKIWWLLQHWKLGKGVH